MGGTAGTEPLLREWPSPPRHAEGAAHPTVAVGSHAEVSQAVGMGASPAWARGGTGTQPAVGEGLPGPGAAACIAASPSRAAPTTNRWSTGLPPSPLLSHTTTVSTSPYALGTAPAGPARAEPGKGALDIPTPNREGTEDNLGGTAPTHPPLPNHPQRTMDWDLGDQDHARPDGPWPGTS